MVRKNISDESVLKSVANFQVCETLRDNENKILARELNSLQKINDNYEKTILTIDKIPLSNEEGIIVKNVLQWLLDK